MAAIDVQAVVVCCREPLSRYPALTLEVRVKLLRAGLRNCGRSQGGRDWLQRAAAEVPFAGVTKMEVSSCIGLSQSVQFEMAFFI